MAYDDDSVRAKLSALNETQESIVTTAQWVMFHRRHAEHTTQLWFQRLKDSGSSKRLNLIYLANDIVQQSRARKKEDFPTAFSPIIADATGIAYKGASNEVQQKLRRVIEVWRQRQIFDPIIQIAIETRVNDIDAMRGQRTKSLTGSIFSTPTNAPSAPPELAHLIPLQTTVNRANVSLKITQETAENEYTKVTDSSQTGITPARQSAQLGGLLKNIAAAEKDVTASISARTQLIEAFEKLLQENQAALAAEESFKAELTTRKETTETKKQEIENVLLREMSSGMDHYGSPNGSPLDNITGRPSHEPDAPEVEPLSPPVEALTPEGSPGPTASAIPAAPVAVPIAAEPNPIAAVDQAVAAVEANRPKRQMSSSSMTSVKKVKFEDDDFAVSMGADAMGGLDEDVAAMLQ